MDTVTENKLNPINEDNRPWIPIVEKFPEKNGIYEVTIAAPSRVNPPNSWVALIEYNQKTPYLLWDLNSKYERIIAWREQPKPYTIPPCLEFPYYGVHWIHRDFIRNMHFEFNVRSGSVKGVIETYDKTIIFPYNFNGVYCFNEKSGLNKRFFICSIESMTEFLSSLYKRGEDTGDYLYNFFGFGRL